MKEETYLAECTSRVNGKIVWTTRIIIASSLDKANEIAKKHFEHIFSNTPVHVINVVCYQAIREKTYPRDPFPG